MPSPAEIFFLSVAALLAGAMNAIAGGGTMLTFPALLAFGMPAIRANATSTVALLVGIVGSTYGYREHLPAASVWIRRFGLVSVIGGFLRGAPAHKDAGRHFRKARPVPAPVRLGAIYGAERLRPTRCSRGRLPNTPRSRLGSAPISRGGLRRLLRRRNRNPNARCLWIDGPARHP